MKRAWRTPRLFGSVHASPGPGMRRRWPDSLQSGPHLASGLQSSARTAGAAPLTRRRCTKGRLAVRHRNSLTLLAYWNARRRGEPAPLRAEILPEDLGGLLVPPVFAAPDGQRPPCLSAGGHRAVPHASPGVSGPEFPGLWTGHDRQHMRALVGRRALRAGPGQRHHRSDCA
jgi:hypothetical protein